MLQGGGGTAEREREREREERKIEKDSRVTIIRVLILGSRLTITIWHWSAYHFVSLVWGVYPVVQLDR